jgi:hypothetical protein
MGGNRVFSMPMQLSLLNGCIDSSLIMIYV